MVIIVVLAHYMILSHSVFSTKVPEPIATMHMQLQTYMHAVTGRAVRSQSEVVRPLHAMGHGLLHKSASCHREEYGGGSTLLKDFFYLLKVTIIFIPNT